MLALIDGDILVYRIGYTTENDEEFIAEARMREKIHDILNQTEANEYTIFLTSTDKSNFRFKVYPEYKANRKGDKPKHYEFLRNLLITTWDATEVFGEEADDALGIAQTKDETIICTIDKDLNQIPGWHCNFATGEKYYITEEEGVWFFYYQLLLGDKAVDNIPGCPGIGIVRANKLLPKDASEEELYKIVEHTYFLQYQKKCLPNYKEDMLRNGQLLKIRTKPDELWQLIGQKDEENLSSSPCSDKECGDGLPSMKPCQLHV